MYVRGMGFTDITGATVYGPPVDPSVPIPESGSALDQVQAEIDALYAYTGAGQQPLASSSAGVVAAAPSTGLTGKALLFAGAGLLAVVLLARLGR